MIRTLNTIALVLIVIGAVNWGFVGLFGLNLVTAVFGATVLSRIIFAIVGLAGLWGLTLIGPLRREACEQGYRPAAKPAPIGQH
jgi:hypothetical protein